MLRHAIILLFVYGVAPGGARPQSDAAEARENVREDGIKKSELGANGSGGTFAGSSGAALRNFRNPVLEYLLLGESPRDVGRKGATREISHRQILFLPAWNAASVPAGSLPEAGPGGKPGAEDTEGNGAGTNESFVVSPTLQLRRNDTSGGERIETKVYPASAIVVTTYNSDGTLKNSVTRYEASAESGASPVGSSARPDSPPVRAPSSASGSGPGFLPSQGVNWPLAGFFPIVINDPFLAAYNGISSSMYATFSSMVEYGPEADICRGKEGSAIRSRKGGKADHDADSHAPGPREGEGKGGSPEETSDGRDDYPDAFDEVVVETAKPRTGESDSEGRRRTARDTTAIAMNLKNGDRVNVRVENPRGPSRSDAFLPAEAEERTRAHSVMLVNPPPLSSIARPSHTGFNMRKKGKPQKPDKEGNEGSSEEIGEEHEETSGQGGTNDGVAISPPPEGASVAEAKPVGLAIAGPGGVAAAKPQGTAVAGPGGLAIARPIGTAIAGVEVEGSVPIGGQQKNKKKKQPKQDPEKMDDQMDAELHYVGGLTGPIGNPQPNTKDFGKSAAARSRDRQENAIGRGNPAADGSRLKLGERDGKYGLFPAPASPFRDGNGLQKRMDAPTFFHGLLGSKNLRAQPSAAAGGARVLSDSYYK